MTLKYLAATVGAFAGAAVIAGTAAVGVTSVASSAPQVQPVVFGVPMPQAPAPELQGPLVQTLSALASPGTSAGKAAYIQGGVGRLEAKFADAALRDAAAAGKFPVTFNLQNIEDNDGWATADVTATAATGGTGTQNITFVAGPSPTGWQMSKASLQSLMASLG